MSTLLKNEPSIHYPESDGRPMADNTLQFEWIEIIKEGCDALFAADTDVVVEGDLLWYPVEGNNTIRQAPDTMVVFGRQRGYRGSYQQWKEDQIAPQVVFEILSPGNRYSEMVGKYLFYERYGVEEYYIYNPHQSGIESFDAFVRDKESEQLVAVSNVVAFVSPRLGVRFDPTGDRLVIHRPDGEIFQNYQQIYAERNRERERANWEQVRAQQASDRATTAESERDAALERSLRLAELLRQAGIDPDTN